VKRLPCSIILCRPEESGNVGSVCRAMKTMGCYDLRIVGEKGSYDEERVRIMSVHAFDIWREARFFPPTVDGLTSAMADCAVSAGTTRRMGQKRKSWGMTPDQFANLARETGSNGTIGLVFGNERTGLTDEELARCALAVNIPSNPDFPSLNLSHAVQIMTYTLFRAFDERKRGYDPVSLERLAGGIRSITDNIDRMGLYRKPGLEGNARFLQGILERAQVSEGELTRLEKLFQRMAWIKSESARDK